MAVGRQAEPARPGMDSLLQPQARQAAPYRREAGQFAIDKFERRVQERVGEARQRREEEKGAATIGTAATKRAALKPPLASEEEPRSNPAPHGRDTTGV